MLTLWTVGAIAEIFECHEHTVRATIRRWQQQGLGGLWEAAGRGTKRLWQEDDMQYLEQCLEQQERTYNSKQLATVLEQERQVNLSADSPSTNPAKKGWRWKRTRHSQRGKQDPQYNWLKQSQLDALKHLAQLGYIELMYLDESGCQLWSPVSYSYSRQGEQKRLQQTDRRKGRISILGLWQPDRNFKYALTSGSFKSESYIKVLDWIAEQTSQAVRVTGRITVVVQDNGSLHKSQLTRQQWQRWLSQGLFLFFLPPYCSEMNRTLDQWHQFKTHEIAGRMFEDEYDLALAMIDGMEARSVKGGYTLERFKFNYT